MISCANKIVSRSNNILSCRNELKNKTRMSLPGFRITATVQVFVLPVHVVIIHCINLIII